MTTTSEELKADAKWLRELAGQDVIDSSEEERLNHIANMVDMMSVAMFTPSLQLEKKAEELMTKVVEGLTELNDIETEDLQLVLLWQINNTLKEGASKALLGQGLAGLGMGAAATLLGGLGKPAAKAPLDPDDK